MKNMMIHGEWLDPFGNKEWAQCSVCGIIADVTDEDEIDKTLAFELFKSEYKFCFRCGARMDDEERIEYKQ